MFRPFSVPKKKKLLLRISGKVALFDEICFPFQDSKLRELIQTKICIPLLPLFHFFENLSLSLTHWITLDTINTPREKVCLTAGGEPASSDLYDRRVFAPL